MRTLAIETATAACSVALFDGDRLVAHGHEEVGRGHAERLVPMIAALPGGGRADRLLVDVGPGSFTGIRVGIAAARGLALGWQVPVAGYGSLPLIAAGAFAAAPGLGRLAVVIEGGHGELFMQRFADAPFAPLDPVRSLPPDAARAAVDDWPVAGSGVRWLASLPPEQDRGRRLPDAREVMLLPAGEREQPPAPRYGRAPDAIPAAARR